MLTRLSDHLARHPAGWVAHSVALAFAAAAAAVGLSATTVIWVGDTLPVVPTVVRMYAHGDRDLAGHVALPRRDRWAAFPPDVAQPHCVRPGPDGRGLYSAYPAGMEVFAWPAVVAAAAGGLPVERDDCQLAAERAAAAIAGGLCVGLFFLTALCVGRPGAAAVTTLLLATGSAFWTTLTQLLWQQTGVVFWTLVVLLVELRARGRPGWRGTVVQAVACSLMLACRPSAVTFLVPFGVWVLARDWRRGLLLPALAVVAFAPWAALYQALYRTPFGPSMVFLTMSWSAAGHVGGVLFSPGRGLFVYQPWAWLGVLLLARPVRTDPARPLPPGWYAFCLAAATVHVALVGSWMMWWGGCCWGSRLAAEVVPLAGLLAVRPVGWLTGRAWGWGLLAALLAAGVALHAPYVYGGAGYWNGARAVDTQPECLWDWSDPPFLYGPRE